MTCKPPVLRHVARVAVERRIEQFLGHFNRGEFFEAHEVLEALWIEGGRGSNPLRGMIQLCAALEQKKRGNLEGARSLIQKATVLLRTCPADSGLNRFIGETASNTDSLSPDDSRTFPMDAAAELAELAQEITPSRKGPV